MKQYDVVIVGGGVVGLTLACGLGEKTDLSIAVLEEKAPVFTEEQDVRVFAINHASERVWQDVGVWSAITASAHSPFQHMHVWTDRNSPDIAFDCTQMGKPNLGYIIEQQVLKRALWEKAASLSSVDMICPATPHRLHQHTITLASGQTLTAALIVGADGVNSWVRQQAGIALAQRSYQQHAIVATVQTEKPHQQTAWQRFIKTGPLALLPLSNPHHASIVWSTTPEEAERLQQLDDATFGVSLAAAFEQRFGAIQLLSARHAFPLHMRQAQTYAAGNVVLVGDAAHTIHPLAGQGVNLGIQDAACLLRLLSDASIHQRTLRQYNRERRAAAWQSIALMDLLKGSFATKRPWLQRGRDSVLRGLSAVPSIKRRIINVALG